MSYIVEIQTEVRDVHAVKSACERLRISAPVHGTSKLFSGEATGWAVHLPGWKYPLVCDTDNGTLHYDNWSGRWGKLEHLARFLQMYAVERAKREARRMGHSVVERPLADGSIKLTINVGGTRSGKA